MTPRLPVLSGNATRDVSVLICTYNRADLLSRALEHIAAQAMPPGVTWEVVVIDNNCTDHTAAVAQRFAADPRVPQLRRVREPQQGIGHARRRAFLESRGDLLVCVDDDCMLTPDWIAQAIAFAAEHPRAGEFAGRNVIVWERPPDPVADGYGESLARQDLGDRAFQMESGRACLVGAAVVVRREAIIQSGWLESGMLVGRVAEGLNAGEDAEIFFRIRHAGWECWYTPQLVLHHIIPESRTTLPYLRRLHRGFGRSEAFLRSLSRAPSPALVDRLSATGWSVVEAVRVLARWPLRFVGRKEERLTWLVRASHAAGCVTGALRYLFTGRMR